jgi:hypothetical protein
MQSVLNKTKLPNLGLEEIMCVICCEQKAQQFCWCEMSLEKYYPTAARCSNWNE